jgi:hypothetical protein
VGHGFQLYFSLWSASCAFDKEVIPQGLKPAFRCGNREGQCEALAYLEATATTKDSGNDKGKGKGEIQGSLHCAAHDRTVTSFGRDDVGSDE